MIASRTETARGEKIDGFDFDRGLSRLPVNSKKEKSIINFYPLAGVLSLAVFLIGNFGVLRRLVTNG